MAMVNESTYEYLLSWLVPAMEAEYKRLYSKGKDGGNLRGLGKYDKNVYQGRVDRLRTVVRNLICADKMKRFLSDGTKIAIYAFNGVCFVRVEDREIFLKELLKRAFVELDLGDKYNDEFPAKAIALSCLDTISSSDRYLYRPNRRYVAFRNLVFDVERRKAVKPSAEQCPAIVLDLEYKDKDELYRECAEKYGMSGNPCRLWETKIAEIIPNRDARSVFQQWCGTLIADKEVYKVEYVLFLIGPGANGKSVLANTIIQVFGSDYFSRFSYQQLFKAQNKERHIASLKDKIANFIDDLDANVISSGEFKTFASGDELQGTPLYRESIKVKCPPLLCCANTMPETDDDSEGGQRRQLVVHTTTKSFKGDERDTSLTYKLTRDEARMYIFHWIVEGYRVFVRNKGDIVMGEDMKKSQELIMAQSNSMRRWWADSGYEAVRTYEKESWRSLAELYGEYKAFAEAEGSRPHSRPELSAMLAQKGCFKQRLQAGFGYCLTKIVEV